MSEYFIGLDIGTESVGWAVTDTQYKIQKKNGKALWGVRLFDEAQKAEERRGFRTARRRLERRKQRIEWLRQAFTAEIAKVDPAFFLRLDESKFLENDKRLTENGKPLGRYTLFADKDYCDKQYHEEFPTIYHLRKALMTEERAFDVRLVYLAIHHIMKNRGHFLFADMNLDDVTFESCLNDLREYLAEESDLDFTLTDEQSFERILTDRGLSVSAKKASLRKATGFGKDDTRQLAIIDLLAGAKVKPSAVMGAEFSDEDDKGFTFKGNFENDEARLAELLGDEMRLIHLIKALYDWSVLDELRGGESCLSFAKVKVYEQHEKDLEKLKGLMKADAAAYKEMFRAARKSLDNYPAYSGHGAANYRCDYDAFCAYAKKQLKALAPKLNAAQKKTAQEITEGFDLGTYLPRQTSKNNGVIPHQLHEQELKIILERASEYLPFLCEKDESGLTLKVQIMEMFRFRVPYYVGPLNAASDHSWIVRDERKIYPWNFDKVVDLEKSAEAFIRRMTATCSYIGEPVLPKDSLLYSRFIALNMINKICVNGHPISEENKQRIFDEHLVRKGKGTFSSVKGYMLEQGMMQKGDELGGIDKEFKVSLTGYRVFARMLSRGGTTMMIEEIIKHIVLFGEDRKLLDGWLRKEYGDTLSEDDIRYIMKNRSSFSGWGNLSAQFLTDIKHIDPETGELISVIDMLWQKNENLMELLSDRYTFTEAIEAYRAEKYGTKPRKLDEVLKDSYAAPGIRRAIHQAMGIISEIEKIMGEKPKRVFVEVTRGEETEKKRTTSRKRQLDELYAKCKEIAPEVCRQLADFDDAKLRSAKYYLYFTQMGKCMYSGEPIDFARIASDYDIDHIYPQMRVKDDSFTNRVLVKRELNAAKGDKYPLSEGIRNNPRVRDLWRLLKAKGLINDEKYRRLTRNTQFADHELSGFIARQLVETSQSTKIVAELLRNRYGDDRVVYVKAKNVSSFRQDQRMLDDGTQLQAAQCKGVDTRQDPLFVKCREVNDFHHAKDAYLNIVVGNVYHVKFTRSPMNFVKGGQTYSLNRMFDWDVVRNGECAWQKGKNGSIAMVRRMMRKNNILFTRHAHVANGMLFKQQIVAKREGRLAMIKSSDQRMNPKLYGGYNEIKGAYPFLVEYTDKKKRIRAIESVYIMHRNMYENDPIEYCSKVLELQDARILIPQIKFDSLFSLDGFRMHISGRKPGSIIYKNANQLVLTPEENVYIKQISKYLERCKQAKSVIEISVYDGINKEDNVQLYNRLIEKLRSKPFVKIYDSACRSLDEKRKSFVSLDCYNQCKILMEVISMLNTTAAFADLKILGGSSETGRIVLSKNMKNFEKHEFKLIHQSVTGFFEQEIDLLGDFS